MIDFNSCSCYNRHCKFFENVKQDNEDESTERFVCTAFPDGIPAEIVEGKNLHIKPTKEQENDIVFSL
jgi:hypothetical protein